MNEFSEIENLVLKYINVRLIEKRKLFNLYIYINIIYTNTVKRERNH